MTEKYSHDKYIELVGQKKSIWDTPEEKYKMKYIPDYLYKYQSFSSPHVEENLALLMQGKIWMPLAIQLNDPFEFQMCSDKLSLTDRIQIREDILGRNTVLSLSSTYQKNLMWSHYADAHKGYCIEFKVKNKSQIYPITYVRWPIDCTYEISEWLRIKSALLDKPVEDWTANEHISIAQVHKIMLYKSSEWKYENEYRITSRDIGKKDNEKLPSSGYVEDLTKLGLKISNIILGFNCSHVDKGRVIKYVNKHNHMMVVDELIRTEYKHPAEDVIRDFVSNDEFIGIKQMTRKDGKIALNIRSLKHSNGLYE